ncbi:hypothetical protein [Streptomyces sp. DT203]|uniref:hypothetical protein n=1 Tax=Streptomyces sp. DT203 TaxID=3393424 RepID=UPI003CE8567E
MNDDFPTLAMDRLLATSGFTEQWADHKPGYFDRMEEAQQQIGVEIVAYCSHAFPMYFLAAKSFNVAQGHTKGIDMAELVEASQSSD